jgi:diguanylate cyclase (GGDEF)-like protein
MQLPDHLKNYLVSVRHLTGAASVSLLISPETGNNSTPMLFHHGKSPFVPELAHAEAAENFLGESSAIKHQAQTRQQTYLYGVASTDENALLVRLFTEQIKAVLLAEEDHGKGVTRRADMLQSSGLTANKAVWLGLRFSNPPPAQLLEALQLSGKTTTSMRVTEPNGLPWSLVYGFYTTWHLHQLADLLKDPVSHLPGRVEFQARLKQSLTAARNKQQSVALALINPDDFGLINHRLGREKGDLALRELAQQLQSALRQSDTLFRYGGAVFGLLMQTTSEAEANMAAERVRISISQQALLSGAFRLTFSIGVAVYGADEWKCREVDVNEMMRRADQALNAAKLSGGGCTTFWAPDGLASVVENLDRLNGIFTADTEKDYRNMLLLWDMVSVITSDPDSQAIAKAFVERLSATFKPRQIGLYESVEEGELNLLAACRGQPRRHTDQLAETRLSLTDSQQNLLHTAIRERRMERLREPIVKRKGDIEKNVIAYAVPLVAREHCLGCLYVDGPDAKFMLDSSDLIFFTTLANQVAIALDRAKLASQWLQQKESERQQLKSESQQLRQEVRGLRNALQHSRLIYRSPQMQALLDVLRLFAPTETTVLITGESGTGKEVLARTLHEQSQRNKQPFVTVDCGAIAQSLMDAELFGRVKGAYTGAQEGAKGRIEQADGGTLFLDEIGELPLEVQTKLLRFVQEKEITPVGSSNSRKVDVRIIAATNRDLAAESAAGTFRQDLYYRLEVVTLTAPPLRERPDDIMPLAYYFLEKYAVQNDKAARHLSPDAEAALLRHPWTGNVRELQNRILQAVIMSNSEEIDASGLELEVTDNNSLNPVNPALETPVEAPVENTMEPLSSVKAKHPVQDVAKVQMPENLDPWDALRKELRYQVTQAISQHNGTGHPLGRWLISDLVLAADLAAGGIARQASSLLGMAETTYRRQLDKARQESLRGQAIRSDDWSSLALVFTRLIDRASSSSGERVVDQASQLLLEEVLLRLPDNDTLGSALLGVTKPTYLRRKASFQKQPCPGPDEFESTSRTSSSRHTGFSS